MKLISRISILLCTLLSLCSFSLALNINSADVSTISQELKGIGTVKAEAIVRYRDEHGPFQNIDDLLSVPGIGPKTLETFKDQLTFEIIETEPDIQTDNAHNT